MSFIQQTESYYTHKRDAADFKRSKDVFEHQFLFDADDLSYLMGQFQEEPNAISVLAQMGGVEGIAYALRTDMSSGLGQDGVDDPDAFALRQTEYAKNSS